jgi:heat shock protein HtpX
MENNLRTFVLMAVLTVLFVWLGGMIGGRQGAVVALVAAAGMNFFGYWFSDKLVLKRYRAREVGPGDDSRLYRIVSELAPRAGLPMPKVYVIPQPTPNAFATGRNPAHAAVAATEGIMDLLDDDELAGVMAHELAHVKHRDILTGTIAATFAGAIAMMGQFARVGAMGGGRNRRQNPLLLMFALLGAPLVAMILRMMISRVREYAADRGGAEISGQPLSLARALEKIVQGVQRRPLQQGNPAHSHLFIVNPFLGGGLQRLFASHPPMAERVRRLEAMARTEP